MIIPHWLIHLSYFIVGTWVGVFGLLFMEYIANDYNDREGGAA